MLFKKEKKQVKNDVSKDNKIDDSKKSAGVLKLGHKSAVYMVKRTWITEKAGDLGSLGKYIFIVDKRSTKPEIKKVIESIYGVSVIDVNTVSIKGKSKRLSKGMGKTSDFKKAIVTLKEGQKIDVMPT